MPTLTTKRLYLRKIEETDAPFFYRLFNCDGWLRYIGDRKIKSVVDAKKQITEKYIPSYDQNGFGSYIVLDKLSKIPIGTCGIYKRENLEHPDLGFAFLDDQTNKGFGYEAASIVLDSFVTTLQLEKVLAFTLPSNTPSIFLLKKLGFFQKGDYTFKDDPEVLHLYQFTA